MNVQFTFDDLEVLMLCAGMSLFEKSIKNGKEPTVLIETSGMTIEQIKTRLRPLRDKIVKGGKYV